MSDTPGLSPSLSPSLSVSIVVYFPDAAWLTTTLESLLAALAHARHAGTMRRARIFLVDNQAATSTSIFSAQLDSVCGEFGWIETSTIAGQGNIGYGRANNLVIARCTESDFHLVLNPDVMLAEDAITNALHYLQQHIGCAMVSPVATAHSSGVRYAPGDKNVAEVSSCRIFQVRPRETPRGLATAWLQSVPTSIAGATMIIARESWNCILRMAAASTSVLSQQFSFQNSR